MRFRLSNQALALCIVAALPSCRWNYELLENLSSSTGGGDGDSSGTGGVLDFAGGPGSGGVGSDSGGSSSGGGSGGSSDLGSLASCNLPSGSTTSTYHVTTGVDEGDGGTLENPEGTGLSLREAITLANNSGMAEELSIAPGLVIELKNPLPAIVQGLNIHGNGATIDGTDLLFPQTCMTIDGGTVTVDDLAIVNCTGDPLFVNGGFGHSVSNSCFVNNNGALTTTTNTTSGTLFGPNLYISGGTGAGIDSAVVGDRVERSFIEDKAGACIRLSGGATDVEVLGNQLVGCRWGIIASGARRLRMWHNTVEDVTQVGLIISGHILADVQNNIFSNAGEYGIISDGATWEAQDHNLFHNNPDGHCSHCDLTGGLGPNSVLADPLFVDRDGRDLSLSAGSEAINAGTDLGWYPQGFVNGAAPDIGAFESN